MFRLVKEDYLKELEESKIQYDLLVSTINRQLTEDCCNILKTTETVFSNLREVYNTVTKLDNDLKALRKNLNQD